MELITYRQHQHQDRQQTTIQVSKSTQRLPITIFALDTKRSLGVECLGDHVQLTMHSKLQDPLSSAVWCCFCLCSTVLYAGFDPLFWLHHCMIDRVLWLFQNNGGQWMGSSE